MTHRRTLLALALAAALPVRAQKTVEGQTFDATVSLGGATLVLNGTGVRAVAWFKGYATGLYLTARASTPEKILATPGPKRLQMRMLQDVPAPEFVKAIDKGISRNVPPEQHAALDERRAEFDRQVQSVGQVKKGDVVNLDFVPGQGLRFSLNGREPGKPIPGEDFYAAVLLIFLGPKPVDAKLKTGLLGNPA